MAKKNKELKTIDAGIAYEAQKRHMTNFEYVDSCFKELMVSYSALKKMSLKEVEDWNKLGPMRTWPTLDNMLRIKQYSTQEEMAEVANGLCDDYPDPFFVCFYQHPETNTRFYKGPIDGFFGHASISITPMGDKSSCEGIRPGIISFESPEDDIIEGNIIAGKTNDGTYRAFLVVGLAEEDGGKEHEEDDSHVYRIFPRIENYLFELESFRILSLLEKQKDKESGVLTVFSHARKLLYSEIVTGTPDLKCVELPTPMNFVLNDNVKATHQEEAALVSEETETKKEEAAASTD